MVYLESNQKTLIDEPSQVQQLIRDLTAECDILRSMASDFRKELSQLRGTLIGDVELYAMVKDIRDKVEDIHNKVALTEEVNMVMLK